MTRFIKRSTLEIFVAATVANLSRYPAVGPATHMPAVTYWR
jgi:hypothetical protein